MAHKLTLLQIVQRTLTALDSDNVDSISDTPESQQVADTVQDLYFDILPLRDWEHLKTVQQLEQVGITTQPTKIRIPDTIMRIDNLHYDRKLSTESDHKYTLVKYLKPEEFLRIVLSRSSSAPNVSTAVMDNNTPLYILTDVMPTYWTSFDDEHIYFDSYYSLDETTVQASKTLLYGVKEPAWTASDTFIPDLPSDQFPLLLARTIKTCSKRFRQLIDEEAERSSIKLYNSLRVNQFRTGGGKVFFNWGMKRRR